MGSLGRPSAATPELSVWLALSPELAGGEDGVDIEGARQSVVPNRREAIRVLGAFGFVSTKFGNAGIFEREGRRLVGCARDRRSRRRLDRARN